MFRNYLKIALRYMKRNKLFTCLNVLGLVAGLSCSILIFLWVQNELSYDKFNPYASRTFRLTGQVKDITSAQVPLAFANAIKEQIASVKNTTRTNPTQKIISVGTRKFSEKHIYYVDTNFLRIFNYPLLQGNISTVLSTPNSAVLTEATAIKYFGSTHEAIGKPFHIDNDDITLQVTGILKNVPTNSHLQFDLLLPIDLFDKQIGQVGIWRYFNSYVYLQLAENADMSSSALQNLEKQINTIRNSAIVNTPAVPANIFIQHLLDIHLYSHFNQDIDGNGNITYLRIFILVAFFIIFIACINFMNLSTALSTTRAKEVGLRKTIGASRIQLILQFLGESVLLSLVSLVFALMVVYLTLPYFNTLASRSISLNLLDIRLVGEVLGITILVGLLAGSYPAFYIAGLKGSLIKLKMKGRFLRNGLVVLQFSISVILIVSTAIIYKQLNFIRSQDIGFRKENLLYIPMPDLGNLKENSDALSASLRESTQIGDFTFTSDLPTNLSSGTQLTWRGMERSSMVICNRLNVDQNFVRTFGMKMKAGRFYSQEYKGDDSEYVVNEAALRAMQIDPSTAIGKKIAIREQEGTIIGVVKDFNFKPLHDKIEPLVLRHRTSGDFLVIRSASDNLQKTLASVQNAFQRIYGNTPFSYGFVDQDIDALYAAEKQMSSLFNAFSILSVIISCLGLFGLTTFTTQAKTKEIGVRKVLGATETGIVMLLAKESLQLVAISLAIAFPIAWYVTNKWLQGFVYKTSIDGWIFLVTGALALVIAFITVSSQTIRAATTNPVNSLKTV